MPSKNTKQTGMGADAFFQLPAQTANEKPQNTTEKTSTIQVGEEKPERRSFNLKPSALKLLDEIQIKTMREGKKSTLSSIVEQGIALVAEKMGVNE